MRTTLETEESEHTETEITLGTATLLSIFFGLVVVCGVFFGFGYSIGRRTPSELPPPASTTADSAAAVPDAHGSKPSAQQAASRPATSPASQPTEDANTPRQDAEPPAPQPDSKPITVADKPAPPPKPVPAQKLAATTQPAAATASPSMVQIAAVSHQEDADVLVSALRKRGYNVSVRTELQDKLLHVQVGPFATRAEANTMKQKLLADGYNAFVK